MDGTTPGSEQQGQNQQQPVVTQQAIDPAALKAAEAHILQTVFNGKYPSVEEAGKGFWNLTNYASQAHQLLQERANPAALAAQREPDPFETLERDALVKRDVLQAAIRREAKLLIDETMNPLQKAWEARQTLATTAPEYLANEPAINTWLAKNPQVGAKVERLNQLQAYDLAAEIALSAWRAANPPQSPGNSEQKQQAQLLNGQVQTNRQVDPAASQDLMQQAIRYGHVSGDKRAAYSMMFPDFKIQIPPHLADQLNLQR